MNNTTDDDELVVEIDLGELDWSTPAAWEDSPQAMAATPGPTPVARPAKKTAARAKRAAVTRRTAKAVTPRPRKKAAARPSAKAAARPSRSSPALPPAFAEIAGRVKPAGLRALVGTTFARLLRALDTLGLIEKALARPGAVEVGPLFEDVRGQAVALLSQITEAVSGGVPLGRRPREVLDGMRFVIAHELTKVFRREFPELADEPRRACSRAELTRAWGLLHNCLQQTAVTLAQAFQPGVTGEHLFEDYRRKVENSFTLYRELHALLRKAAAAERSSSILLKHALVKHLEHFREETMHFLIYKDWAEFGRYVDDVKRAFEEMKNFESVLHEFSQYLGMLVHHVGMREVLRGVSPHAGEERPAARARRRGTKA